MLTRDDSYFWETGRYNLAWNSLMDTYALIKGYSEIDPLILSFLYFTTGVIGNECDRVEESVRYFKQARSLLKKTVAQRRFVGDMKCLAQVNSSLGNSLNNLNRFEESEKCHVRALQIAVNEKNFPIERISRFYANLGSCLLWKGDLDNAEKTLHTALLRYDRSLGCCLYALGNVYLKQGNIDQAFELHLENLQKFAGKLGRHHPYTAESCYKVGSIYAHPDFSGRNLSKAE